ncbi:hypothetical protein DL93DRAFT_188842 [Clavulina sp. PMI_390]|nr:hypothetical protein DL93DRAFT_188842 [Clavulina sp. PMI_390]
MELQMHFTTASAALLTLASIANAATVSVSVGSSGLTFGPQTATANVGDTVTFNFAGPHSATQVTFATPCTPMSGGFDSGISSAGKSFSVMVNDTNPIWVSCQVPGHCQAGMVFAINAPTSGNNTFQNFQASAEGKSAPASTTGGGSSTGSAPASSTGSSPATSTSPSGGGGGGPYGSGAGFATLASFNVAGLNGAVAVSLLLSVAGLMSVW